MSEFAKTHARSDNIDTSHIAAERAETMADRQRIKIFQALAACGPQTSDEIAIRVGLLTHQVIKRVSDLRNDGVIIDTGERKRTRTGRPAAVWKLKPEQLDMFDVRK